MFTKGDETNKHNMMNHPYFWCASWIKRSGSEGAHLRQFMVNGAVQKRFLPE